MFFYEGYSCPVCDKAFTEADDVVACPVCGAPHHRACWQTEGRCHLAALHGTPEQWSRESAKQEPAEPASEPAPARVCPNCGCRNPEFAEFCSHCGRDLDPAPHSREAEPPSQTPYREYTPFHVNDTSWSASPGETIGGAPANDLAAAVGSGAAYYMPRFRRMAAEDTSVSWNWAAFALSAYWLFFRKQYLLGTVYLLLQLVITVLSSFFYYTVFFPLMGTGTGVPTPETQTAILQQLENGTLQGPLLATLLLFAVMVISHIFLGLFGNKLYFGTCVRRALRFREKHPDGYPAELSALGGTSLVLGFLAYVAIEFIGSMIVMLLL